VNEIESGVLIGGGGDDTDELIEGAVWRIGRSVGQLKPRATAGQ
jgi:hypothetical protein